MSGHLPLELPGRRPRFNVAEPQNPMRPMTDGTAETMAGRGANERGREGKQWSLRDCGIPNFAAGGIVAKWKRLAISSREKNVIIVLVQLRADVLCVTHD